MMTRIRQIRCGSTILAASVVAACGFVVLSLQSARADLVVEVSAGKHDRIGTPVSVALPALLERHRHFTLERLDNSAGVSAQLTDGKKPRLVWMLGDRLAKGETRSYRLAAARPATTKGGVAVQDDGRRLRVEVAEKPVLVYNASVMRSPNREEPYYDRSGYLHPLYNPRGQVVTDDFAPDHPHQHGLMFPWTNTTFEGRPINFWDQKRGKGKIEHAEVVSRERGPVFGGFSVRLNHLDVTSPQKPKPVLEETWRVRVYNATDYFLFDLDSVQQCVGAPLRIEKYHYGGMAIRGHRNWLTPGQGDFLTSEGKTRQGGNHSRPRWCDIHGQVAGQTTGVTIFGHPNNFRSPQPVRLHPDKPYFCFAPMVLGEFEMTAERSYVSRYRFYVHTGKLDVQTAERMWHDIAEPPGVTIVADSNADD